MSKVKQGDTDISSNKIWLIIGYVMFVCGAGACSAEPPADTIYRNGYIYTVDARSSTEEALAIRDGVIVYVGNESGAQKFAGRNTKIVDLDGRMMMPGRSLAMCCSSAKERGAS